MRVVGLTGGIGTGKSTVAAFMAEAGVPVVDADQVARQVVDPGPVLDAIVAAFGSEVLDDTGQLNRAAMRQRIATEPAARRQLEAITHPAIGTGIVKRLAEIAETGAPLAVVEAALMVETGSYRHYGSLVVVTCSPARQLAQVLARDGGPVERALGLIDAQMPLDEKEAVADHVIHNEGSLSELKTRTLEVLEQLRGHEPGR